MISPNLYGLASISMLCGSAGMDVENWLIADESTLSELDSSSDLDRSVSDLFSSSFGDSTGDSKRYWERAKTN